MLGRINQFLLALRMGAPQQENKFRLLLTHYLNNSVSKVLPALFCMGRGIGTLHRHRCIEQQNTLLSPMLQAAVGGDVDIQIALELFINIDQRGRGRDTGLH